jgi:hypothetical protein
VLIFYKVLEVLALLYGPDNWAVNKTGGGIIERTEMKFQKCASGHTLKDQVRITNIIQLVGVRVANERI